MINSKGFKENLFYGGANKPTGIIRCNSGIYVDIFNPTPEMFEIEDIAHGLSMMPRFGGHTRRWYSVAEHCTNAVYLPITLVGLNLNISLKDKFDILMHDCSEAYLMDIPSPIKKLLTNYCEIEDNLMKVLSKKFDFTYPLTDLVKEVDKKMLELEWDDLILNKHILFDCKSNNESKNVFLTAFKFLKLQCSGCGRHHNECVCP